MKTILTGLFASATIAGSTLAAGHHDILVIEVAGQTNGVVEIKLLSDVAPQHVERIKSLANEGKYDGVIFHRVIEGFMAQTGDVQFGVRTGTKVNPRVGTGSSDGPNLPAEFSDIQYTKGVVGMARSQDPNSANSQFFIMFDDAPSLNSQYTVVGKVISGQEVVDAIKRGNPANNGAVAIDPDYMARVTIK